MGPVAVTLFLLACGFCTPGDAIVSYPRVATPLGILEGTYNTTQGGRQYESYIGVPYAQPPTGKSRFQTARYISPWSGVRKAQSFGSQCMQYDFTNSDPDQAVRGSEDCLYLNIYTPSSKSTCSQGKHRALLPVILFIPGGGFAVGDGNSYGPKFLLDRDVLLVTMNYRLGPMGFLNTEDATVPGNAGLKDQVMALLWVNYNIRSFGGDPSRVTIAGQSAGASAAHFLYLTKLTTGLFKGGISMSGTAMASWALQDNPLQKAKMLAAAVGCSTDDTQTMVDCLQDRPAKQVVQAVSVFLGWPWMSTMAFVPTVERCASEFTFIDRTPYDVITSGDTQKVPWLTGTVSEEGLFPLAHYAIDPELYANLDANWTRAGPYLLSYNDSVAEADKAKVGNLIRKHYIGQGSFGMKTLKETLKIFGDRWYYGPIANVTKAQAHASKSPIYTYHFTYRGAHSGSEFFTGPGLDLGVGHGDDLSYVLYNGVDPTTTPDDLAMQKVMIDLWVSFATNGKPNVGVEWPRLSRSLKDTYNHLYIAGPRNMTMRNASNVGDPDFWRSIGLL